MIEKEISRHKQFGEIKYNQYKISLDYKFSKQSLCTYNFYDVIFFNYIVHFKFLYVLKILFPYLLFYLKFLAKFELHENSIFLFSRVLKP